MPLLVGLGGCSDGVEANFVGVDLYVTFDTALPIVNLDVVGSRVDDGTAVFARGLEVTPPTTVTATRTARMFLSGAAEHAGEEVRIVVTAEGDGGEALVTGTTRTELELGFIVTATMTLPGVELCGNGTIDDGETCDPGPTTVDGCTVACRVADGFVCGGRPSRCGPVGRTAVTDASAATCPGTGAPDEPFCRLERALMAPWADTIVLRAGRYRESVRIDRDVVVVADAGVTVESADSPTLHVDGANVTLVDVEVSGLSGTGGGVRASGAGAVLELEGVRVTSSSTVGVATSDGAFLRAARTWVLRNTGGLDLDSDGGFVLESSVVAENAGTSVVVRRASAASRVSNLTIVGADPLRCDTPARFINTIAWGGTITATVASRCEPIYADFGPLEAGVTLPAGSFSLEPMLTDDYHLEDASPCRDTGDPASIDRGDAPAFDIDGEARPKGPNVDVGADER